MRSFRRAVRLGLALTGGAALLLLGAPATAPARHRSPTAAFATAVVPGSVVHGLGNFYAGERRTAGLLFVAGAFGAGMIITDNTRNSSDRQVGGTGSDSAFGAAGRVLFFGSWLYDVLSAPAAAKRHNRRHDRAAPMSFQLEPLAPTPREQLQPTFRYTKSF